MGPLRRYHAATLPALAILWTLGVPPALAGPEPPGLGAIDFPTSGSPEAQRHFLRGVGALHSFWYEEALKAFREATRADPGFAMGYWGEAMAHNHPVWREQDTEAGRAALARIPSTDGLPERERAYVEAVRVLYGEGPPEARDKAYAEAMERLAARYPDDLEAACFYALALLGIAKQPDEGLRTRIKAGAVALEVFRRNPRHPCGAHYAIHAFDDPDHAILALPAAKRYAAIAPAAHHAQHMPAHIFVQLGLWPEAAASNKAGWEASKDWVAREGLTVNLRDYHSLHWLTYVYLQQGRYREAEALLAEKRRDMAAFPDPSKAMGFGFQRDVTRNYDEMAAAFVVETERWELAPALWDEVAQQADVAGALPVFTLGLAAAMRGQADAERAVARLHALRTQQPAKESSRRGDKAKMLEIRELEVQAVALASQGRNDEALALMQQAVGIEESLPPPAGPPDTIKPPHELLGELLLRAGRPQEAARQFAVSLKRHPNRARSLLGAARAAAKSGDRAGAAAAYAKFLDIWAGADPDRPELPEARAVATGP
ncbi:tetratricopeptide repeat protein [Nitrospira sp. Kam-Ns4a]